MKKEVKNLHALEKYVSEIEMEIHRIAYNEINFREIYEQLVIFQSHCDFNLFFLYSIAPGVILHLESIKFLNKNKQFFKRKLSIKEILKFDTIIFHNEIETFENFKRIINS